VPVRYGAPVGFTQAIEIKKEKATQYAR